MEGIPNEGGEKTDLRLEYWKNHYTSLLKRFQSGEMSEKAYIEEMAGDRRGVEVVMGQDKLTGAYTRGHMEDEMRREMSERPEKIMGLALVDLDHFKEVNDNFGHQMGDKVLVEFVRILRSQVDKFGGSVGRWGGEEFVVFLPGTSDEEFGGLIKKAGNMVKLGTGFGAQIPHLQTMSAGVTMRNSGEDYVHWLERVDKLVYEAKGQGRNQMVQERQNGQKQVVMFDES